MYYILVLIRLSVSQKELSVSDQYNARSDLLFSAVFHSLSPVGGYTAIKNAFFIRNKKLFRYYKKQFNTHLY